MNTVDMARAFVGLLFSFLTSLVCAQSVLPKQLDGFAMFNSAGGARGFVISFVVKIDSTLADGSIAGTMNWDGIACRAKDLPFTGTYSHNTLQIRSDRLSAEDKSCSGRVRLSVHQDDRDRIFYGLGGSGGREWRIVLKPK